MKAIHISIYGEFNNVGFRDWAKIHALKFNLTGWVRKSADGSIEIFIQGEDDHLNDLVSLCWDGPSRAYVDDVLVQDAISDNKFIEFNTI